MVNMMRVIPKVITPGRVALAAVAVLALGGTANAASHLINGSQIENGTITTAKIAADSIGPERLKDGAVTVRTLAPGVRALIGGAGATGPAGAPGSAGAGGFQGVPSLPMSCETLMTMGLLSPEGENGARDDVGFGARWGRGPRSGASRRRAQRSGYRVAADGVAARA